MYIFKLKFNGFSKKSLIFCKNFKKFHVSQTWFSDQRPTWVKHLSGAPPIGRLLASSTNISLGRKALEGQAIQQITSILKLRMYKVLVIILVLVYKTINRWDALALNFQLSPKFNSQTKINIFIGFCESMFRFRFLPFSHITTRYLTYVLIRKVLMFDKFIKLTLFLYL